MFGALYTRGNVGDQYVIKERNGNGFWLTVIGKYFPVRDEAKAAAQADYERRVRSALAPEPAEREATTRKIYLASRYSRFPEMQKVRTDLEAAGYIVTSRWINGGHELTKEGSTEAHEAERVRYAQEDFADLLAADCVISFTEIPRETKTRGGRHVEHGMALALGKRVIVIGYRENVFHCLPQCEFFTTWADALASLSTPGQGGRAGEAPAPDRAALIERLGERHKIEHDGFEGEVIGSYTTREGKRGVVLQQIGTKVVHVYGEKWIAPLASGGAGC